MEVLILLILTSLLLAGGFLAVFIWASRSGQYEDTTTPALRMLTDDPQAPSISQSQSRSTPVHQS